MREILEETGLSATLYDPDKKLGVSDVKELSRPMHILLEDIGETHKHIDLIYYAKSESNVLNPQDGETNNLKWFTASEIKDLDAPENVKVISLKAIDLLQY